MVFDDGHGGARRSPLRVVEGQKEAIALWVLDRLPAVNNLPGGYEAIGFVRGDDVVGGVVYTSYSPAMPSGGDIQIWGAGETGWLSRRSLFVIFAYPFQQLKCHRVTAIVAKKNRRSRKMVEDIGFRLEGVLRQGTAPRHDAMIYGMLADECKWVNRYGQDELRS